MKLIFISLFIIFAVIFSACEETVDDATLEHQRAIVVRAVLTAGDTLKNVDITRTLAPLDEYDSLKVRITNADARVIVDGISYQLKYLGRTLYGNDSLVIQPGKTYNLEIRWDGLFAYASTTVPEPVSMESVYGELVKYPYYDNGWLANINANFRPKGDCVYLGFYIIKTYDGAIYKYYSRQALLNKDARSDGLISIPVYDNGGQLYSDTTNWRKEFNALHKDDDFGIETYDKPFWDYYQTRNEGQEASGILGGSGINVKWNVKGQGLGMFIGCADTRFKIKL